MNRETNYKKEMHLQQISIIRNRENDRMNLSKYINKYYVNMNMQSEHKQNQRNNKSKFFLALDPEQLKNLTAI